MLKNFKLFESNRDIDPHGEENWDDNQRPYNYNTTLRLDKRIINPKYINVYKLKISNMHGDADQYTTNTLYIENEQEVKNIIEFCKWTNSRNPRQVSRPEISRVGEELFGETLFDFLDSDVTTDHQYVCRPSFERLTFFDDEGIEWNVVVNCV
jgi:hypothetical protein